MMMEQKIGRVKFQLMNMGLNEYQASSLANLLLLGEVKAATLSKASGVPSARIYDILEELSKMGLITIRPGRPTLYSPRPPGEIVSSIIARTMEDLKGKIKVIEGYSKEFTTLAEGVYLRGRGTTERPPLLRIVRVGEVSLGETKRIYSLARASLRILTRAMEYFPEVAEELSQATARGVSIQIIMLNPELLESEDRKKQKKIVDIIGERLSNSVRLRFADEVPIRGCTVDPAEGGQALFLVEEPGVPFFLREAAITSHSSVVKGLAMMFDLIWQFRAKEPKELSL